MKQAIPNYTFDKATGQVTFTDFGSIVLERVLLVVNVTDGIVVYQFNDPTKLASVSTNVLDLAYDTSAMDNTDDLLIIYDVKTGDPVYDPAGALPTGASTSANQTTIIGHVDGIETVLATIDGRVDGLETLITSTNTKLDTLNTTSGDALTDTELRATPVPVSGTITATVSGVSTAANQTTIIGHVDGIETAIASTNTKLDTVITNTDAALTDTELRASAVPVSVATIPSHAVTNAGTFAVQAAQSGAWTVDVEGDSVSSQTALTTVATVSGSAGTFHGGSFINLNSAPAYIQIFDTTGAVTLGTTTPTFVQPIPANSTAANGAGFVFDLPRGINIVNGIKIAATTTPTGATTVPTALTGFVTYR